MIQKPRRAVLALAVGTVVPWSLHAQTLSLSPPLLSEADAQAGMRAALDRAAGIAVDLLGRTDAYMGNPRVRVPLPGALDDAARQVLAQGQRRLIGELVTAMNRVAEAAVPDARPLLAEAVRTLRVDDAVNVLSHHGERGATLFLEHHTRSLLAPEFLPIVRRGAERARLAQKYDSFAARVPSLRLLGAQDADLPRYVARKALDGLFLVIGDQEARFRADPTTTGSAALARVFRALKP